MVIAMKQMERTDTTRAMRRGWTTLGMLMLAGLLAASTVHATPRTLIDSKTTTIGGFGGPVVTYTTFNGQDALMVGGQGAMLVNKSFYIGGGGYGMSTRHRAPERGGTTYDSRFEMGYGGAMVGMVFASDDVVHFAGDVLVGGGAVLNTWRDSSLPYYDYHEDEWDQHREHSDDPFFVVQPMLHLEMNVLKFWRVGFSGGYRFVDGVNSFGLSDSDLSGPVAGLTFRFGKF